MACKAEGGKIIWLETLDRGRGGRLIASEIPAKCSYTTFTSSLRRNRAARFVGPNQLAIEGTISHFPNTPSATPNRI